jgi:nucleoside-diphosphate kinase
MIERTLVIIKPDSVKRKLVGDIIKHFEKADLTIIALNMLIPNKEILKKHYPENENWFRQVGKKTKETYKKINKDVLQDFSTIDELEIGKIVKKYMVNDMTKSECIAMVIEGNLVIQKVLTIRGETFPSFANLNSIRGKYGSDSADLAYSQRRAVQNLIHTSSSYQEACYEIELWFPQLENSIQQKL